MRLEQIGYSEDNLGYVVSSGSRAMAVDGGDAEAVLEYIQQNHMHLEYVTNTHSHRDHTCGNSALLRETGAEFVNPRGLETIFLGDEEISVIPTPGHTADSVCFHFDDVLLTGDTLFNGKVGRCFTGDSEGFFMSIARLLEYPDSTLVYAGHDYVLEYIEFDRRIEPDNICLDEYIARYDPSRVVFTLGDERKVDPFLHLEAPAITRLLKELGLPRETPLQRWKSLLTLM